MNIEDKHYTKYVQLINSYELLTYAQEIELGSIIQKYKSGNKKQIAREKLMNHNLRLVMKVAFKYYIPYIHAKKSELTIMDLIGAGSTGLMEAVDRYDPMKYKNRFSTYATSWIKQRITALLYSNNHQVHIPMHIINGSKKYKDKMNDAEISDKDAIDYLETTENGLANIKKAKVSTLHMDAVVANTSSDNPNATTYRDFIESDEDTPFDIAAEEDEHAFIKSLVETLDPMSRDIIQRQYLDEEKTKLSDIGKKYKISGERVRQIKEKALTKMKFKLNRNIVRTI